MRYFTCLYNCYLHTKATSIASKLHSSGWRWYLLTNSRLFYPTLRSDLCRKAFSFIILFKTPRFNNGEYDVKCERDECFMRLQDVLLHILCAVIHFEVSLILNAFCFIFY